MRVERNVVVSACMAAMLACGGKSAGGPSQQTGTFFENAGARLSYEIDRPSGSGLAPGIVLVHEGGAVTKNDLAAFSASLTQRGFVVLRYDKRGVGQSTGAFEEVSVANSDRVIALLAGDVVAAVQTLRQATGVDASRVGLVGASQAGWVMPVAASQLGNVRFLAAVVGPTVAVGPLYYFSEQAQDGTRTLDQLSQVLAAYTGPAGFDPGPVLQSLNLPAFWLMASDDRVVPTRESVTVINGLIAAGKPYRVTQYSGGHALRQTQTFYGDLFAWLDTVRQP